MGAAAGPAGAAPRAAGHHLGSFGATTSDGLSRALPWAPRAMWSGRVARSGALNFQSSSGAHVALPEPGQSRLQRAICPPARAARRAILTWRCSCPWVSRRETLGSPWAAAECGRELPDLGGGATGPSSPQPPAGPGPGGRAAARLGSAAPAARARPRLVPERLGGVGRAAGGRLSAATPGRSAGPSAASRPRSSSAPLACRRRRRRRRRPSTARARARAPEPGERAQQCAPRHLGGRAGRCRPRAHPPGEGAAPRSPPACTPIPACTARPSPAPPHPAPKPRAQGALPAPSMSCRNPATPGQCLNLKALPCCPKHTHHP
jgi:hypothetical protein